MCEKCVDRFSGKPPEIEGGQFGAEFYELPYTDGYGNTHTNTQFRILSEDDEHWHLTGLSASVVWLNDLIKVLQEAKAKLGGK